MHLHERTRLMALMAYHEDLFPHSFVEWFESDNQVWDAFLVEAQRVRAKGFKRYSTKAIIHFLRHHTAVAESGTGWKINNNHSPYFARLFDLRYPEMAGMWEYRVVGSKPNAPKAKDDLLAAAQAALQVFEDQGWGDDLIAAQRLRRAIGGGKACD